MQFQTPIVTLYVRWHTTWWNEWIPAFRTGAANFNDLL